MHYAVESVIAIKEELQPLTQAQWLEVEDNQDKIKLNENWEVYDFLESNNLLRLFTVRKEQKLIGYFCVTMGVSLHHKDHKFAVSDVIYLMPEHRSGMTAHKLISYAESNLRDDGVDLLTINTKVKKPFDRLLERMNYSLSEKSFIKYIGS